MILGVGLDLCDIARIERAISNPRFCERIFSEGERERIRTHGAQTAAGFFAAKEAVSKALGTGFRGFGAWDIEVVTDEMGCPGTQLKKGALARMQALGGTKILLSITHTGGFAAAVAILSDDA